VLTNPAKMAVLVLNFNGKHHLIDCLSSLNDQTYDCYEVYLIDNGSSDGSIEFVEKHFPWVKIMAFEKNFGFAKAYNRAINECGAELIALLNNDTRVNRRWLQELVKVMSRDESTIIVGSKLLLYDSPQLLNHAGAKIASIGGGFDVGLYEKDSVEYSVEKPVGAVCGAAMLFRKELFKRIGAFDEDFFAYFEDIDLCWRSWLDGYKVLYVPTSIAQHKFGGFWASFPRLEGCILAISTSSEICLKI
jgi:GT2 family glycosyltransferase